MVMMTVPRCIEVAGGQPDVTSPEFRNAVSTMRARIKASKCLGMVAEAEGILASLLAHGEPRMPEKKSREEIAEIRRKAGSAARMSACKESLRRKLFNAKHGFVSLTDRKPTVFDAALEMIEDGEVLCVYQTTDVIYSGPISEGGRRPVRRVTVANRTAHLRGKEVNQGVPLEGKPCLWKSARRQAEEETQI